MTPGGPVAQKKLRDVLGVPPEDIGTLRWQVVVPLGTNPFLLFELFQFALAGAAIVLLTLCVGVWASEGMLALDDLTTALKAAAVVLPAVMGGFIAVSALFFGNRYYAVYQMDSGGIYHEGSRGKDERKEAFCLRVRPFPVTGAVSARRTRSRHLPWEKMDRFQDIPSMRTILLRRSFWHMLRLYTPDAETHARAVSYLAERLKKI